MKQVLCFRERSIPTLYTAMQLQEIYENIK